MHTLQFIKSRVQVLQQYFGDLFDLSLQASGILILPGDALGYNLLPPGCLIAVPVGDIRSIEMDAELAHQVAGQWIGVGIQIVGDGSLDLEYAIRLALALRWLKDCGEHSRVEALLRFYRKARTVTKTKGDSSGVDPQRTSQLVIDVYDTIRTADGTGRLRQAVSSWWGRIVSANQLKALLRVAA